MVGGGVDAIPARELVLKVEEGLHLPAAFRDLETLLHGHFPATDERTGLVLVIAYRRGHAERSSAPSGLLRGARRLGIRTAAIVTPDASGALRRASSRAPAASSCRTIASSRRRWSRCCPRRSRCSTSRSASCTRRAPTPTSSAGSRTPTARRRRCPVPRAADAPTRRSHVSDLGPAETHLVSATAAPARGRLRPAHVPDPAAPGEPRGARHDRGRDRRASPTRCRSWTRDPGAGRRARPAGVRRPGRARPAARVRRRHLPRPGRDRPRHARRAARRRRTSPRSWRPSPASVPRAPRCRRRSARPSASTTRP